MNVVITVLAWLGLSILCNIPICVLCGATTPMFLIGGTILLLMFFSPLLIPICTEKGMTDVIHNR